MRRAFLAKRDNPRSKAIAVAAYEVAMEQIEAGQDIEIEVREPKRTLDANACMWATLGDIAAQVDWPHTDRAGRWAIGKMSADSWKAVLTAGFEQETRMAQGVAGGMVMLGARTSQYSRRRMGEFIEFAHAFGAERGVRWSAKAEDELAMWAKPGRAAA